MKKTILIAFLSFIVGIPLLIALCNGVTIFYANGMNNDPDMARKSLNKLADKLTPFLPAGLDVDFQLAYNHNEGFIPEMVEVTADKALDNWKSFWNYLSDIEIAPDWFQTAATSLMSGANALNYLVDADLQNQVAAYQAEIASGRKVIVVAHSQGNFYANAAYDLVNSPLFSVIGVASPANYVAGDGPYVTLGNDLIINALHALYPSTLPSNATNNSDANTGWMGHDFNTSYLEGDVTGPMITKDVTDAIGDTSGCEEEEEKKDEKAEEEEVDEPTISDVSPITIELRAWGAFCSTISASFAGASLDITKDHRDLFTPANYKEDSVIIPGIVAGVYTLQVNCTPNPSYDAYLASASASIMEVNSTLCNSVYFHGGLPLSCESGGGTISRQIKIDVVHISDLLGVDCSNPL